MHELAITQSILDIAVKTAKDNGGVKVKEIRIKMGEYSGVVPSLIQEYFDLVSRDTLAEKALLIIDRVPLTVRCLSCGFEGAIDRMKIRCPICGGTDLKLLTGREFYVDSLEVEELDGDKGSQADPGVE